MTLHPDVEQLAIRLGRLEDHLAKNGASNWATSISRCRAAVENSDARGLGSFMGMFGGMGSLNDLVLHRNGTPMVEENDQLQRLKNDAWSLAHRLHNEAR
jgi:hypothetical protein